MRDWNLQLKKDAEFARRIMLSQGEVAPMFALHCHAYTKVIGAGWSDTREKRLVQKIVSLYAVVENAEAISFISEAWVSSLRRLDTEVDETAYLDRVRHAPPPSEDPQRQEVLLTTVVYHQGSSVVSLCHVAEIIRDSAGKPVSLEERPQGPDTAFTGMLVDLLPPARMTDAERKAARSILDSILKITGLGLETRIIHPEGHA